MTHKKKLLVLSSYPIFDSVYHGGITRVLNFLKNITEDYDITILSPTSCFSKSYSIKNDIGTEYLVRSGFLSSFINRLIHILTGLYFIDPFRAVDPFSFEQNSKAKSLIQDADIVLCVRPYVLYQYHHFLKKKKIVLDMHDIESQLYSKLPLLSNLIKHIEATSCRISDLILVLTDNDRNLLDSYYSTKNKTIIIQNGIPFVSIYPNPNLKKQSKLNLGFSETDQLILFIGSNFGPNISAVKFIIEIANLTPEYRYIILGSVVKCFDLSTVPSNIFFTGMISESKKNEYLFAADLAIHPIFSGSGSNAKIGDYLAFGLPIISTSFGLRGWSSEIGIIAENQNEFKNQIDNIMKNPNIHQKIISKNWTISKNYSWSIQSKLLLQSMEKLS